MICYSRSRLSFVAMSREVTSRGTPTPDPLPQDVGHHAVDLLPRGEANRPRRLVEPWRDPSAARIADRDYEV